MEVEMEDIFQEPVVDIDFSDTKNTLVVVEYVEDLYAYYRKMEIYGMVSPNYMLTQQFDINERMRAILIEEKLMLNTMEFNMSVPTPYLFLKRYLKVAQSDSKLEQMSSFLIELCLVEYEMIKFSLSFLAAVAVYTAQCSLYGLKQWSNTCEWHTNYSEHQLLECSRMIVGYHQKAGTGRLIGVYRKYNTSKFGHAAECEPAKFILELEVTQ